MDLTMLYGGYDICQRNEEVKTSLEFCVEKECCWSNACFRGEKKVKLSLGQE